MTTILYATGEGAPGGQSSSSSAIKDEIQGMRFVIPQAMDVRTGEQPHPQPRVLIVEDEPASRRAMESLFRLNGFSPVAVGSAEEALDRIEQQDGVPEIALVDLDLPGMDGLSLIKTIAKRGTETRSVLITAHGRRRLDAALRRHAVEYLRKPIDFRQVLELIAQRARSN